MATCPACGSRKVVRDGGLYICMEPGCGEVWEEEGAKTAALSQDYGSESSPYDDENYS